MDCTATTLRGGTDYVDGDTCKRRTAEARVARQQSRTQAVCEGDIRSVVRCQVGAKLPDPLEQGLMSVAHNRELDQILERTLRSSLGEPGRPNKTAENRRRLDDRQVGNVGRPVGVSR